MGGKLMDGVSFHEFAKTCKRTRYPDWEEILRTGSPSEIRKERERRERMILRKKRTFADMLRDHIFETPGVILKDILNSLPPGRLRNKVPLELRNLEKMGVIKEESGIYCGVKGREWR